MSFECVLLLVEHTRNSHLLLYCYCALLLYIAIIDIIRHGPRLKHSKIQM